MVANEILTRIARGDFNNAFLIAFELQMPRDILNLCAEKITEYKDLLNRAVDADNIDAVGAILAVWKSQPPVEVFSRVKSEAVANAILAASNVNAIRLHTLSADNANLFDWALDEQARLGSEWHRGVYINGKVLDEYADSALQHAILVRASDYTIETLASQGISDDAIMLARNTHNINALIIFANSGSRLDCLATTFPCVKCHSNNGLNLVCDHILCFSCLELAMSCSLCN